MAENRPRGDAELNLEKLGIRQIRERIEVSPLLTDPGADGTPDGGGAKTYTCNIHINDLPGKDLGLR